MSVNMWNMKLLTLGGCCYCDGSREEDTPRSSLQPAETDRQRTDPELCAPEPSGTVGSLRNAKQKRANESMSLKDK